MKMLTTLSPQRFLAWASICFIVFFMAWYDTANAHIFSYSLNEWILQNLYAPPITELMSKGQEFYRDSLEGITGLGTDIILLLALGVIFLDLLLRREFKPMLYCLLALFIILSVTILCKLYIFSPRPMFPLELDSFPSGHVVRASIWCGLIIMLGKMQAFNVSKYWRLVWLAIPLLVAYSRVGLGYHWLSDVIASLALSLGAFLVVYYFIARNNLRGRQVQGPI
jgi:membrane-associated phospholipid phosphatase